MELWPWALFLSTFKESLTSGGPLDLPRRSHRPRLNGYLHDRTTPALQSNETIDGLDPTADALRHAAEDTAKGAFG
jgi:hypothetical protein